MPTPSSPEKRLEWETKLHQQKESGLSVDRWCRENHVTSTSFYYWKERLYPKPLRLSFAELSDAKGTGITIEHRNLRIRIDKYFDPSVLKRCLSVLIGI